MSLIPAFTGWRTKVVTESIFWKRKVLVFLPLHQEQVHHILLTHLWYASLAGLLYPCKCGKLSRRTVFLGCSATTKPSGRAESPSDIFRLQGEGKSHQCSSASGAAGGMGYGGASLTSTGRRGYLALETCTHSWFLPFLAWWWREVAPSSQITCSAPQQTPWQGIPPALKTSGCLPLHSEVSPWDLKGCWLLQLFRRTSSTEREHSQIPRTQKRSETQNLVQYGKQLPTSRVRYFFQKISIQNKHWSL